MIITNAVVDAIVAGLKQETSSVEAIDGNKAAAIGARLCRPQVVAAYPITPQTPLVEYLARFVAEGQLNATMIEVESEHSCLSALHGASLAGARTFTSTCGQGLLLMFEPYVRTSSLRLPIVLCIPNRETLTPCNIWGGQQDAMLVRDAGWIQMYCEENQEILDTMIMAYRIAEHPDVLLPVNVCYDGFFLSHMAERVEIPTQEQVDAFLPPYRPTHQILDPERPMSVDPLTPGDLLIEYRYKHVEAMRRAKDVIEEVHRDFAQAFGRSYGGLVETYRLEDAEMAIVAVGSPASSARDAVDIAREDGLPIGLLKIKTMRPFPRREVCQALAGMKAIGVMDRSVQYGWGSGVVYTELRSALADLGKIPPTIGFIDGLGGTDITLDDLARAIHLIELASRGIVENEITWLALEEV